MFQKIILFTIFLGVYACTPKSFPNAEVYYNGGTQKTISLTAKGYGKTLRTAQIDAEKNAFNTLLFRGIPENRLSDPLIANEEESKRKHEAFLTTLIEESGYRNYVTKSSISTPLTKDKVSKSKYVIVEITINIYALRNELEEKGVIRKFGF